MRKRKFGAPPGQRGNPRETALPASGVSNRSAPVRFIARAVAATTPQDLPPDEVCQHCASPFQTILSYQKFCSRKCRIDFFVAKRVQEAAAERAALHCVWCGNKIPAAKRTDQLYCSTKCWTKAQAGRRREAARRRERALSAARVAELRARLVCVDCGVALSDAKTKRAKLCPECRQKHTRENKRRSEQKARAKQKAENGKVSV